MGGGCTLQLSRGIAVAVRCEPITDGSVRGGAILRLRVIADDAGAGSRVNGGRGTFGWDSLTDTERSVTTLVAQGLTNREAAERLFLSRHTVGLHLRSIYRKLGVSPRVDLTRASFEHDDEHARRSA